MAEDRNAITSKEVLLLWFSDRANAGNPEHKLRPALRAGLFNARANLAEVETRGAYGGRGQGSKVDWDVPADVWKGDQTNSVLDLRTDYYSTRAAGTGFASVKLHGLQFDREPLLRFLGLDGASIKSTTTRSAPATPNLRGAGKPPNKEAWTRFAAAFALASSNDVDLSEPGVSANSIYGKVDEIVRQFTGEDALGIDSVRDAIMLAQEWAQRSRG